MTVKSEGFGFCLEVESDNFEDFLREIVNTEMDQIEDIKYDKGEKADIDFEDSSRLTVVPSDLDNKDIHIHYVPGSDLENTSSGDEISSKIEELIDVDKTDLKFFALSLRLDVPTAEAIRELGGFNEEVTPKGLELEKEGDTYSVYEFHKSEDTIITVRLNSAEYETSLEDIKIKAADCIDNFLNGIGESYEA